MQTKKKIIITLKDNKLKAFIQYMFFNNILNIYIDCMVCNIIYA